MRKDWRVFADGLIAWTGAESPEAKAAACRVAELSAFVYAQLGGK